MIDESQDGGVGSDFMAWAILAHILASQVSTEVLPDDGGSQAPLSEGQMQRVHDYLQNHLQGGFRISELAMTMGMSRTSFFKRFGHTAKVTPNQYLQILRVEKAKQLLHKQDLSLIDIAFACGYSDQSHLARFFKRYVRMSPGRYRNKIRESDV